MMETVIEQLETRINRLITEIESLRVARNQFEAENDGLKITLADYEQVRRERDEALEAIVELESAKNENEEIRALTEERDTLRAELDEAREALAGNATEIDQLKAQAEQREARVRERLTSLLDRISAAESYIEKVELVHESA